MRHSWVRFRQRQHNASRHYRREAPAVGPTVAGVWRWDGESRSAAAEGRAIDRGGWDLLILVHTGVFMGIRIFTGIRENGKNGKRSKTKLVTERRVGDRPNGKSQYKSDFGSSWNFWDFGQMWIGTFGTSAKRTFGLWEFLELLGLRPNVDWNFWDFGQMWIGRRVGISQNLGEESDFAKSHLPGGYMLPP